MLSFVIILIVIRKDVIKSKGNKVICLPIFNIILADGLTDCEDPECCEKPSCKQSQLCMTVDRPINILLQRQPPASTASFFQKMRFIIEEGSLQRYADNTAFNER